MTIWVLALLLLASLAALGFRQGAIRVGISFVGILLGAILAPPLGHLLKPVLSAVGFEKPFLQWVLGPFIVFVLISALMKNGALAVAPKMGVDLKYKGRGPRV